MNYLYKKFFLIILFSFLFIHLRYLNSMRTENELFAHKIKGHFNDLSILDEKEEELRVLFDEIKSQLLLIYVVISGCEQFGREEYKENVEWYTNFFYAFLRLIEQKYSSSFSFEKQIIIILLPVLEMFLLFENFLGIKASSLKSDAEEDEKFDQIKKELCFVEEKGSSIDRKSFLLKIKKLFAYYEKEIKGEKATMKGENLYSWFKYYDEVFFALIYYRFNYEAVFEFLKEEKSLDFEYLYMIIKFLLLRNKECLETIFLSFREDYGSFFNRSFERRCFMCIPICGLYKVVKEGVREVSGKLERPFEEIYNHVLTFDITSKDFPAFN